jgi:hypothetical protein
MNMNNVCSKWLAPVLAAALALTGSLSFAQSDLGSIQGFIKDPSGAMVSGAKILVKNQAGLERPVTTNDAGYFIVTNIPPGSYSVSAEARGFKKYESVSNNLAASAALSIDIQLTLGATTETVEVSATASALQTESASVQKDVTREQIDALELNGRNPVLMANLVPGTRGGNLSGLSFGMSQGPSNINGARTGETLITYDGAPAVRTRANGSSIGAADVDSTQEVQIMTSSYGAEYGRSSGGQIRILTKTGTSDFHGAAYEYVRNTDFNANTWGRNTNQATAFVAPIHYNQFGYNVGGPFFIPGKFNKDKNKIFWYWGQEWVKYHYTDSNSMEVPSLLMRQGNFSEYLNPTNVYYGKVVQLKDPSTGAPIAGNIIPLGQVSSNGLGILKAYPVPNLTTPLNGNQYWYKAAMHPQNQRKDTLSADFNLSDTQRLQFRRMSYAWWEYQPLDGGTDETPKFFNRPNQTNSLDYVWTLSPNKVNEVLLSYSQDNVYIPVDGANFLDRTKVGLNYPYIFPNGKMIQTRIPTVNMAGFSGLSGGPYPSHSVGPIATASDSFTWIRGSHTMKFGFYWERSGENDNDEINVSACPTCTNNQNGQFSFTDTRSGNASTGNAGANAAMGLFDTYSELGQRAYTLFRGSMYEAFAQDSWKVNQKLHIDYGVRYTINVPYSAIWRNMSAFDPMLYDPSKAVTVDPKTGKILPGSGDRYNGIVIPGSGFPDSAKGRFPEATDPQYSYLFRGANPHFMDIQWNQWQPRFGLAYQMTPKTVIRVGGGRFFTRLGVSDSIFLGGNAPFQPTANVTFGSVDNPGGTSTNLLPLTATTFPKDFKNPESWAWNAVAERELPWKVVVSAGYVGRRGLHLQREVDINQPTIAAVQAAPAGTNIDSLRPYKGYNSIRMSNDSGRSLYNSAQFTANRRFSGGLLVGASYTYSKSMDDGSQPKDIIPDTYYARNMWGPSDYDVRNIFIMNYLYELPIFRNSGSRFLRTAFGGWQLNGITQWQTGTPGSVIKNNDYAGVGVDGSMNGSAGQYFVINGSPVITGQFAANGTKDPAQYFTVKNADGTSIFTAPAKGTFNTAQAVRNIIYNPGFNNSNVGLFKKFAITEKTGMQFRAQAFNVFNHPNWSGANFDPTNAAFGKITGKTGDVRNLQLSLRFFF